MVCCRDSGAFDVVTLFWRNHGREIFRRPFCDLVGIRPLPPADGPAPSLLIVADDDDDDVLRILQILLLLLVLMFTLVQDALMDKLRHVFHCALFYLTQTGNVCLRSCGCLCVPLFA